MGLKNKRRVYGKPWSKLSTIQISDSVLKRLGQIILDSIKAEAAKDMAQGASPEGKPMNLPQTQKFIDSLSFTVNSNSIDIHSDWPWFDRHIEGRDPYPMVWSTKQNGVSAVPMAGSDGKMRVVKTPLTKASAWIHPGVKKFTFVERGVANGRKKAIEIIKQEVIKQITSGDPLK